MKLSSFGISFWFDPLLSLLEERLLLDGFLELFELITGFLYELARFLSYLFGFYFAPSYLFEFICWFDCCEFIVGGLLSIFVDFYVMELLFDPFGIFLGMFFC